MSNHGFVKYQCAQCGSEWFAARDSTFRCENCRMTALFAQLPAGIIAEADQKIFERTTLPAIQVYWKVVSLADARDLHDWRSGYLREHFPEKFKSEE